MGSSRRASVDRIKKSGNQMQTFLVEIILKYRFLIISALKIILARFGVVISSKNVT